MKKVICVHILFYCFLSTSFSQSKEIEAQYAYTKAEKAFDDSKYDEGISYCDEAALKLGETNSKILYLKLKCYQKLVDQDCVAQLANLDSSITISINLFFDITNSSVYPKEKYFEIIDFKTKYQNIKDSGCPKRISIKNATNEIEINDDINSIYDKHVKIISINGVKIDLSQYKGKKMLIVNTASKDAFTPQYSDLQKLYEKFKDKLVVVCFPSNDFANQEPGSNEEIKEFIKNKYRVTFPMSQKISVRGENIDPFFKYLVSEANKMGITNPIKWNFTKFLFDEDGNLLEVFPSKTQPLSQDILKYLK